MTPHSLGSRRKVNRPPSGILKGEAVLGAVVDLAVGAVQTQSVTRYSPG